MSAPAKPPRRQPEPPEAPETELPFRTAPHNLEAEQALLGAILCRNDALDRVSDFLDAQHFYDPLHQQIYETAGQLIINGKQATPITLRTFFETAESIDATLTVSQYLGRLAANAATIINARDYGRTIYDLATRRQLIVIGEDMVNTAYDSPVDFDPEQQLSEAAARLNSLAKGQPSQLVAVTLSEFLNLQLPEHEWILRGLLQQRGIALVYAWRGVGKTWFTLSMASAISSGGRFLKWEAQRARGVLYVDGEMPAVGMQERLSKLVGGAQPGAFRLLSADLYDDGLPDLATAAGQAAIERVLGEDEVLFLDNLSTLCRTGVENEAESWLPVQQWLLKLRRRGKTVVLVHHAGKGNAQRGTSRREDVLDLVLSLKAPDDYNPDDGARFEIRFEKGRGLKGDDKATFEAQLSSGPRDELLWTCSDLADAKEAEVLELNAAGESVRNIAKKTGMSKSAVQRLLARCPTVPSLGDGDRRDTTERPGRRAGQKAGRAARNVYAAAKSGD